MYCSGCGQAMVAGQGYCPRCGRANAVGGPMRVPMVPVLAHVERQVNHLAVAWFVYAGLMAVFGVFGLAFAQAALSGHMGPWMNGPWANGHTHWHGFGTFSAPWLPLFFVKLGWVWLGLRVGLAALAGYGLSHKTSWGRWVAIVAGILALFHIPWGTAVGIWTLVVLARAPNAAAYEAMVRE